MDGTKISNEESNRDVEGRNTNSPNEIAVGSDTSSNCLQYLIRRSSIDRKTSPHSWDNISMTMENTNLISNGLNMHFLHYMCQKLSNEKYELVLRGKDVERRIGRRILDTDIPFIMLFLDKHPHIISLDLSYNNVTSSGSIMLFEFLTINSSLISLNLMQNDILASKEFNMIPKNVNLKVLRLNGNSLGFEGGKEIGKLLTKNGSLEILDLGQTDQNIKSALEIFTALMTKLGGNSTLKVLNYSRLIGRLHYDTHTADFALQLMRLLYHNTSLVELHIGKNKLTDNDIENVLIGLRENRVLELLDLSANHLSGWGLKLISDILPETNIRALILSANIITDVGAKALASKMANSKIELLDLSHNHLTDFGLVDIVTAQKAVPLLSFFIFGNQIASVLLSEIEAALLKGTLFSDGLDIALWRDDANQLCHAAYPYVNTYTSKYYSSLASNVQVPGDYYLFHEAVKTRQMQEKIPHSKNYSPTAAVCAL